MSLKETVRRIPPLFVPIQIARLLFEPYGYLRASGWLRSMASARPSDRKGNPLPWLTHPFVAFVEPRLRANFRVFEYGSGYSTQYWAERVAQVVAVESDAKWAARMHAILPENTVLLERPLETPSSTDAYVNAAVEWAGANDMTFHMIVIDGRERTKCALSALGALAENGVLVWDDSTREAYLEGQADLLKRGFRRLDFEGLKVAGIRIDRTSVFYRPNNCLNI